MIEAIEGFRLPRYAQIPDVGLYLEQVVRYVNTRLAPLGESELTSSMVSNHVKQSLIPAPIKKTYPSEHLARLLFIAVVKPVVPLEGLRLMFSIQEDSYPLPVAYDYFCDEFENMLGAAFGIAPAREGLGETQSDAKDLLRNTISATVNKVYPIENYGSAMAPFYTTLAIWVGGVILSSLVKIHARTEGLIDPRPAELYFGRYLFFFLISQIQAAVIVTGDLYLLKIQCLHPGLLYLTASLTAFTFSLLIYSLAIAFGDVGKAVVVVIMVMQIAGSSGTFPIELLPEIYQKIYRFFPFPYAIDAMRECICGMYGNYYWQQIGFLLLFAAAALLIGLLVRRPFMGLNRFMEEKLEETELL